VTEKVHEKGGIIFYQLWNLGLSNYGQMEDVPIIGSGTAPHFHKKTKVIPIQMTKDDINRHLRDYKQAAMNAIEAGFDGVEIHGALGSND
jgi:2,4-dienoyl-CoA reductase-like NADH-dependent reductase (Old Yellow Enzyme family)